MTKQAFSKQKNEAFFTGKNNEALIVHLHFTIFKELNR